MLRGRRSAGKVSYVPYLDTSAVAAWRRWRILVVAQRRNTARELISWAERL